MYEIFHNPNEIDSWRQNRNTKYGYWVNYKPAKFQTFAGNGISWKNTKSKIAISCGNISSNIFHNCPISI